MTKRSYRAVRPLRSAAASVALSTAILSAPAMAQETAAAPAPPVAASPDQQGVLTYPPEYFAAARPATALEMVQRTPGFSFENGSSVRGFAGGAGNVLVDGERPLTKTETLEDILRKIPASSVLRIEVIRGGAPGIDMQGRTVLANVVRKSDVATTGAVALSSHFLWDGRILPGFRAEFQRRGGGRLLELSTIIGQGPDDSTAGGNRIRLSGAGATLIQSDLEARSQGTKYWYTGAYETPFAGGKLRIHALERVGDIAQENQPQDDVLVLGCVNILAQLIGGFPELFLNRFGDGGGDFFAASCHELILLGVLYLFYTTKRANCPLIDYFAGITPAPRP